MAEKMKTLTPRQIARRRAVLRAVREHLEEHGLDGLSMRNVAVAAHVSPSTLYEIYGSKEALIWTVVGESLGDLATEEVHDVAGLERFVHRLDGIARIFEETPRTAEVLTRMFFEGSKESPATRLFLDNAFEARRASVQEMLDAGQLVAGLDVELYARALVSVTWGTALFWLKGVIPVGSFRAELVRSSLSLLLAEFSPESRATARRILEQCSR